MITFRPRAAEDTPGRLFTIRQVAELAGISIMTIRRWIDDHGLSVHRIGRHVVRVSQTDLNPFFSAMRPPNDDK